MGGVTSALGSFSTFQVTAVAATIEGVTVTVNTGDTVPGEFDIIVTKD